MPVAWLVFLLYCARIVGGWARSHESSDSQVKTWTVFSEYDVGLWFHAAELQEV